VSDAALLQLYRTMFMIRRFEDGCQELFGRGAIAGTTHLCSGQEGVAVGVAAAMRDGDWSIYTYRSHGHVLARGMSPEAAFAEMLGRSTGCNRGKGGSMHLTDASLGLHGCFAIVGAGLPVAVGLGRAAQLQSSHQVAVAFFGDGATNIGAFHESLNLAAVWQTPVVFVCENNLYGEYTPLAATTPVADISERAHSYAMPATVVDGQDVEAVFLAASSAIERARGGEGPSLLECKTYRFTGHSKSDPAQYRPEGELEAWLERDPLVIAKDRLVERGNDPASLAALERGVEAEVTEAMGRAEAAPWPELEEIVTNVYA
jgi:TPP-dependent pyruvate/acetoin dehydrogenase alpha subunit